MSLGSQNLTQNKVTSPKFSKPSGSSFSTNTKITLSCDTTSVSYYYTLDGTTPTTSSTAYSSTNGITVNSSWASGKTIKVILENETKTGIASKIDEHGALVVKTEKGEEVFCSADIVHIR